MMDEKSKSAASEADDRTVHVLFSAHGVPQSYVTDLMDPYQVQLCCES